MLDIICKQIIWESGLTDIMLASVVRGSKQASLSEWQSTSKDRPIQPVKQAFTSQASHDSIRPTVKSTPDESSNMIGFISCFVKVLSASEDRKMPAVQLFVCIQCVCVCERVCICACLESGKCSTSCLYNLCEGMCVNPALSLPSLWALQTLNFTSNVRQMKYEQWDKILIELLAHHSVSLEL